MAIMRTGTVTRAIWPYVIQRGHHQASRYVVSGITRDSSGTVLPFCNVELYEAQTSVRAGVGISDANGVYEIEPSGYDRSAMFFARAWKADPRTNYARNSTMIGATPGASGTGVSNNGLPDLWQVVNTHGTVTKTCVGVGEDENGNTFIDLRFNGTTSTTSATFATARLATSLLGGAALGGFNEVWASSMYLSLVGGDFTNVTNVTIGYFMYDSSTVFIATNNDAVLGLITSSPQRFSHVSTVDQPTTAIIYQRLGFVWTNATAIDFTIRIAAPQLERDSVTDVIKTYGEVRTIYDVNAIEGTTLPTLIVA